MPQTPVWIADDTSRVAIVMHTPEEVICVREGIGRGFCLARCEDFYILAGYLSPNSTRDEALEYMDTLSTIIRGYPGKHFILIGDA